MKIVITGATGFIGPGVVAALRARGDTVIALARDAAKAERQLGVTAVAAELETPGPWTAQLDGAAAVVHLAGEPIAGGGRWTARDKQRIRDSRVESTRVLVETIAALAPERRPRVLVTASGADYYGFADPALELGDEADRVTEVDPPGEEFLARVCKAWEAEARAAESLGLRTVQLRTGLVLGPGGGALATLRKIFKRFVGGRIGSGRQWFSWIHRDDLVAAYVAAVHDDRYRGPINAVAPELVRQHEIATALGRAWSRPSFVPTPAFAVRLALGELAEYLLNGRCVVPARLTELGFAFTRPTLAAALRDVDR